MSQLRRIKDSLLNHSMSILTGIFAFLCLLHYFSQRPLWIDEMAVFENIRDRNYAELFSILGSVQVFPRIQLIVIKYFSTFFHFHLLSLRLFSLISMGLAFFVWRKIFEQKFAPEQARLSVLLFAFSFWMGYYSAELKPYATDVLAVGLYLLFILKQNKFQPTESFKEMAVLSVVMPFLIFFSYGAIFVFWIPIFNFLLSAKENRHGIKLFLIGGLSAAICSLVFFWTDISYSLYQTGIEDCWANYFISLGSLRSFFVPFGEGLKEIGTWWYGNGKWFIRMAMPFLYLFVYALVRYGFPRLKKDRFRIVAVESLGFVLFIELVVFSLLEKYPFTGDRVTLFFAPFVFYFVIRGLSDLKKFSRVYALSVWYLAAFMFISLINNILFYINLYVVKS